MTIIRDENTHDFFPFLWHHTNSILYLLKHRGKSTVANFVVYISSLRLSNGSTLQVVEDKVSLALSTDDSYDEDGSFLGEYSNITSGKKYEEMFV